jgi:hypothetical protein
MTSATPQLLGPVIITRYLGPTNCRSSRVVATHQRDSEKTYRVTLSWDDALNSEANHQAAADALLAKYWPEFDMSIVGRGYDHSAYYWLSVRRWQVENFGGFSA